jgi:Fe-S-cluster containining protein
MCGDCCYGEGGIFLAEKEQEKIARFLGVSREGFLSRFCEQKHGRIYIKTGENNFCIFYEKGKGCAIHPVKPARCSLWPYYPANINDKDTWGMAKWACRGINRECSFEEFVMESKSAKK